MKKVPASLLSILTITLLLVPPAALAQATATSCVVSKVGNPAGNAPQCASTSVTGGTSSNAFVKTAEDIKAAYDACGKSPIDGTPSPGLTFEYPGLETCLANTLKSLGYKDDQVNNFITRQGNSLVSHSGQTGSGQCTECLGYVGEVIALWSNMSDPNQTLNTLPTAGSVNDLYSSSGFEAGGKHWVPLGTGLGVAIQPGDIAVAGSAGCGCDHIGIVHEVIDDISMNLIESNGGYDCRVTTVRANGSTSARERYTYYRAE
ncbi:MAG TPA: hypothetical protein VG935_05000 [Patescibacteria group bacterium]|nr:hypothetical protein [Patescibacteria group bacterium]